MTIIVKNMTHITVHSLLAMKMPIVQIQSICQARLAIAMCLGPGRVRN